MPLAVSVPLRIIARYPIVYWRYRMLVYSEGTNSGSSLFIALRAIFGESSPVS